MIISRRDETGRSFYAEQPRLERVASIHSGQFSDVCLAFPRSHSAFLARSTNQEFLSETLTHEPSGILAKELSVLIPIVTQFYTYRVSIPRLNNLINTEYQYSIPMIDGNPENNLERQLLQDWEAKPHLIRIKGRSLEDNVSNFLEGLGCEVQSRKRLKDSLNVLHEIDVYATYDLPFGRIKIAAECKDQRGPAGIEDLRNFAMKLQVLKINFGIFVSTNGYTPGAISFAKSFEITLWSESDFGSFGEAT